MTSVKSRTSTNEPMNQVKLLSALRRGDHSGILPFLSEIQKSASSGEGASGLDTGAATLHLAIRCASADTVGLLLSHRAISPNGCYPAGSGISSLHLAASIGRADICSLLLDQDRVDDTLRDAQGKTCLDAAKSCKDLAKGKAVSRVIQESRSLLNASFRSLLHTYALSDASSQPASSLIALLESPRVRNIDLSYLDQDAGTSLLHEAAKRNDLRLIELSVRAGADVFVRDRRGKAVGEGLGKDDRVRVFLRQFANHDTTLLENAHLSEPPALRGYLNKFTNVAQGFRTRWFVLQDGVLSYYRHQDEEQVASRGSISMRSAILKITPGPEKLKFEIHSTPSHGTGQKWYVRTNHPVEAARWIQAIQKSMDWYKQTDARYSGESDRNALEKTTSLSSHRSSISSFTRSLKSKSPNLPQGTISGANMQRGSTISGLPSMRRKQDTSEGGHSMTSSMGGSSFNGGLPPESDNEGYISQHPRSDTEGVAVDDDNDSSSVNESDTAPFEDKLDLHANSTSVQLDMTVQMLFRLALPANSPPKTVQVKQAVDESLDSLQGMLSEYMRMVRERDEWWKARLYRETQRQAVWEESLQTVVKEGEMLEEQLRTRSRKRGSRFFDAGLGDGQSTVRQRPPTLSVSRFSGSPSAGPETAVPTTIPSYFPSGADAAMSESAFEVSQKTPNALRTPMPRVTAAVAPEDPDSDEEMDEFFDAIEANNLPGLVVDEAFTSPDHSQDGLLENVESYSGYKELRTALKNADDRPNTSLWAVLKNSIGKDITKISFPVSFNEPTSMLQRMAEDMEFSECLDAAAQDGNSLRRIAYVAAFAMSNYSSTLGRIAKPFNPMLGETFEYVRLDKGYRYFSEQVGHHPPSSASMAESASWKYYGEVDAQNKFLGKSLEIRPTGIAHAELFIDPPKGNHHCPAAPGNQREGKVIEHYSWKKVTTSISGFLLGTPTIDHYGDMIVTNHRTHEKCVLHFKPRGWLSKDSFEIAGEVHDAAGNIVYKIAGRWNSQLIARDAGSVSGSLDPDMGIKSPEPSSDYFLLWRNSPKPEKSPFNLSPFALTLNYCSDELKPFLAPTDCRLRPDQRAFEEGKYDLANELKNAQEQKQRVTKKLRDQGDIAAHKPRWFSATTDGDTGERVWIPSQEGGDGVYEYWAERERVWKAGGDRQGQWKDVDEIFLTKEEIAAL